MMISLEKVSYIYSIIIIREIEFVYEKERFDE